MAIASIAAWNQVLLTEFSLNLLSLKFFEFFDSSLLRPQSNEHQVVNSQISRVIFRIHINSLINNKDLITFF